jgi:hypothetical protein
MVSLMADNACYRCSATNRLIYIGLIWLMLFASQVLADEPFEVAMSLKVHQITSIDQKAENFSVVATLMMEYNEPGLAAKTGETVPPERMYQVDGFSRLLAERGLVWPAHSFYNVQGRIHYQNRIVVIDPLGNVDYFARFTATFQAPDFDFRLFPLDHQIFDLKLDLLSPVDKFVFKPIEAASGIGDTLGEEEWILGNALFGVTTTDMFNYSASRFILSFEGSRHLSYYVVRILVPVVIIILVSWFSFFLNDYSKRIDLAGGNLLLFIAFNFTIANDLPRLGYLTLMDTIMLSTFAITGVVVLMNVWLRRLQNHGRGDLADKLDGYAIWGYPVVYAGSGLLALTVFYIKS